MIATAHFFNIGNLYNSYDIWGDPIYQKHLIL
jgi:hypothetical protein